MSKYIKYYYITEDKETFCCELPDLLPKRHPWKEYEGLDVKIWLTDSEGVDSMLAELPDSTPVSDIMHECGKKAIQVITEEEYISVATPYFESQRLYSESYAAQIQAIKDKYPKPE